jgi:hypothetical protein
MEQFLHWGRRGFGHRGFGHRGFGRGGWGHGGWGHGGRGWRRPWHFHPHEPPGQDAGDDGDSDPGPPPSPPASPFPFPLPGLPGLPPPGLGEMEAEQYMRRRRRHDRDDQEMGLNDEPPEARVEGAPRFRRRGRWVRINGELIIMGV